MEISEAGGDAPSSNQDSSLELKRAAVGAEISSYVEKKFSGDAAAGSAYAKDGVISIAITGERSNLRNMYSGKWNSSWKIESIDGSKATISGEIKIHNHYFEEGNIQLQTNKPVAAKEVSFSNEKELGEKKAQAKQEFVANKVAEARANAQAEAKKEITDIKKAAIDQAKKDAIAQAKIDLEADIRKESGTTKPSQTTTQVTKKAKSAIKEKKSADSESENESESESESENTTEDAQETPSKALTKAVKTTKSTKSNKSDTPELKKMKKKLSKLQKEAKTADAEGSDSDAEDVQTKNDKDKKEEKKVMAQVSSKEGTGSLQ